MKIYSSNSLFSDLFGLNNQPTMKSEEAQKAFRKIRKQQQEIEENAAKFKERINKDYSFLDEQLGKLKAQQKELKELKEQLFREQLLAHKSELKDLSTAAEVLYQNLTPRTGR